MMSEDMINSVWSEWKTVGCLSSDVFGNTYLAENGDVGYAAVREIRVPPDSKLSESAEKRGIDTGTLRAYFGKFKNNLTWELMMFRSVKSANVAAVDDMSVVDSEGPGFTAYIRTALRTPLAEYYKDAQIGCDDALRLGIDLCTGLNACQSFGMVHGGLAPSCVFVDDSGHFVLGDFGIRRCLEKAGATLFPKESTEYEAPEASENGKYSMQSDIYSVGMIMAYAMNGGALPGNGEMSALSEKDAELSKIIEKAVSAQLDERYKSAEQMLEDLLKLSVGESLPQPADALVYAAEKLGVTLERVSEQSDEASKKDEKKKIFKFWK